MFKVARFLTLLGLSLATSSFLGLVAKLLPPVLVGLGVVFLLLVVAVGISFIAGPLLDNHFGWEEDTSLGLAIGVFTVFVIGSVIGWLVL